MRSFLSRLWATLARGRRDRELDEEVRFHLEMLAEEYRARGMSPRKAGLAARREFGGAEQVKETYRDGRGFMALDSLLQDIRFALRMLRRERRFTVVAVSTLALGIGATTAMFAVVEHAILRPLPLPHADRLVAIESTYANSDGGHTSAPGVFVDWRESAESFEAMAGLSQATLTWVNPGTPRRVRGLRVSRDFFDVTGLPLLQGRTWTAEEDTPQGALVAIVTERFWKNDLNGDEGVLGRRIQLNESAYVVIGVAPSGFRLETVRDPEIFLPLQASQTSRFGGPVMTVGRRRPGVSLDAAQAEMETVMAGIRAQSPSEANTGVLLTPLHDWVLGDMRVILSAILGSVACVWLIGCANLSNMQLARSASRLQELAVRASLGAGRMRLIRQVLIETTVTASLGGAMGLPLAWGVLEILPEIESTYIPRAAEMRLSSVGIAFAVMAILLSGLLIGAAPALQAGRRSLNLALNGGAAFLGQSGGRLRSILVAAQLALSVMLLAGAGLLCNSFLRLLNVDLGFDRNGVIAIEPRHYKHLETETAVRLLSDLQTAVNRMQGVESTSLAQILPLDSQMEAGLLLSANLEQKQPQEAQLRQVSPNYFTTFRIPLIAGRDLEVGDERRRPVPILLSRQAARLLYGRQEPLGRRLFNSTYGEFSEMEVVGVVDEVRQRGMTMESPPIVYMPIGLRFAPRYVVARLAPGAPAPAEAIREALRDIDASMTVEINTMDGRFDEQTGEARFFFRLIGGFALAGLLMAAVGVFGVTSYAVAQRGREFAIRIALGARERQVLWIAARSAFFSAIAGLAVGLVGAFATTGVLQSVLYDVRPDDPATLVAAAVLLAAISLAAATLAGLRATEINPAAALKQE